MYNYPFLFNFLIVLTLISSCFLYTSCEKDDEQIKSELRNIVRKEVTKRTVAIRPELDSLCQLNQKYMIRQAVDSIYNVRIEEVRKIAEQ